MSVTVQSIVDQVQIDWCEDAPVGLVTGTLTQTQILDHLGVVLMDFLRQTGLAWTVFTQLLEAGVSQYLIPDSMTDVYHSFVDAKIIEQVDLFSDYLQGQWTRTPDYPKAWHEDGLPNKTIEVVPAPNWNGVPPDPSPPTPPFGTFGSFQPGNRDLTFVGPTLASKETWSIGDTLDTIPDTFTPYLVFGILARVFAADAETRDLNRSRYCEQRYQEGISLGKSILMEMVQANE
jgi:hypothetical protein